MAGETRQTLIHLHTSDNRAPSGSVLTVGEIAVSHPNVQDAALYTKIDNNHVAKFITDIEIDTRISAATEGLNNIVYTREEFSATTISGSLVDTLVVRNIIEENERVTAAAINTVNDKVIELSGETISEISAVNDSIDELSGATISEISSINSNIGELSGATVSEISSINSNIDGLSGGTVSGLNALDDKVGELSGGTVSVLNDVNELSGATVSNLSDIYTKIEELSGATTDLPPIIDTVEDFWSGLTESGSLVDALVVKDVIVENNDRIIENEQVTSASLNDLNGRINTVSGTVIDLAGEISGLTFTDYASAITINGTQHNVSNNAVNLGSYLSASTDYVSAVTINGTQYNVSNKKVNLGSYLSANTDYVSAVTVNGVQYNVSGKKVNIGSYLSASTAHVTTIPQTETSAATTTVINYMTENGTASSTTIVQDLIIDCGTF